MSFVFVSFLGSPNQVTFDYVYSVLLKEILVFFRKVKEDKSKDLIVQLPQLLSGDISFLQNTIINIVINYICCSHTVMQMGSARAVIVSLTNWGHCLHARRMPVSHRIAHSAE